MGTRYKPILFLEPQPFYTDRGTPIALQQVLEALSTQGIQTDILTYSLGENVDLPGLRTIRIKNPLGFAHVPIGFSWRKVLLDFLLLPKFLQQIRKRSYACIHAVEEAAFLAVLCKPWHRLPIVYDMASCIPEQLALFPFFRLAPVLKLLYRVERWLLRRVDLIVCSRGLASHVHRSHPAARVVEWQFPVRFQVSKSADAASSGVLPAPTGSRCVLYSGNFAEYQGVSLLLEAMKLVSEELPDAVLILVGDEPDGVRPPFPFEVELQEKGALKILPRVARNEVLGMLSAADVLVLPRRYGNNLPLKVFEYLASGKPIVAVNLPCYEGILDSDRALFVEPEPGALGRAIVKALEDRELAQRLGQAARKFAESSFGWQAFVKQVLGLYREVGGPVTERHAGRETQTIA